MKRKASVRGKRVRLAPGRRVAGAQLYTNGRKGPSGTVALNESAAAILALCDGTRTRDEIVNQMLRRASDTDERAIDVREFLDAARAHGWIVER
jgi:coenzyme PQQ biosynthesis protein PqqD